MKEETMLEVFRIARDLAVADHQNRLKRSDTAKAQAAIKRALDNAEFEAPTVHDLFVESYRFMTSELSALQKTD